MEFVIVQSLCAFFHFLREPRGQRCSTVAARERRRHSSFFPPAEPARGRRKSVRRSWRRSLFAGRQDADRTSALRTHERKMPGVSAKSPAESVRGVVLRESCGGVAERRLRRGEAGAPDGEMPQKEGRRECSGRPFPSCGRKRGGKSGAAAGSTCILRGRRRAEETRGVARGKGAALTAAASPLLLFSFSGWSAWWSSRRAARG